MDKPGGSKKNVFFGSIRRKRKGLAENRNSGKNKNVNEKKRGGPP